jgi:hypothetical protein
MTYAVDSQELLDIEEDLNWMETRLDLVNSGFRILLFWWKSMQ